MNLDDLEAYLILACFLPLAGAVLLAFVSWRRSRRMQPKGRYSGGGGNRWPA